MWSYWVILSSTTLITRAAAQMLCRSAQLITTRMGWHRYSRRGSTTVNIPDQIQHLQKSAPISYSEWGNNALTEASRLGISFSV